MRVVYLKPNTSACPNPIMMLFRYYLNRFFNWQCTYDHSSTPSSKVKDLYSVLKKNPSKILHSISRANFPKYVFCLRHL